MRGRRAAGQPQQARVVHVPLRGSRAPPADPVPWRAGTLASPPPAGARGRGHRSPTPPRPPQRPRPACPRGECRPAPRSRQPPQVPAAQPLPSARSHPAKTPTHRPNRRNPPPARSTTSLLQQGRPTPSARDARRCRSEGGYARPTMPPSAFTARLSRREGSVPPGQAGRCPCARGRVLGTTPPCAGSFAPGRRSTPRTSRSLPGSRPRSGEVRDAVRSAVGDQVDIHGVDVGESALRPMR